MSFRFLLTNNIFKQNLRFILLIKLFLQKSSLNPDDIHSISDNIQTLKTNLLLRHNKIKSTIDKNYYSLIFVITFK